MNCNHSFDYQRNEIGVPRLLAPLKCIVCNKTQDEINLTSLREENERLRGALKSMLSIFDRGLSEGTFGRKICDEAKQALEKKEGE